MTDHLISKPYYEQDIPSLNLLDWLHAMQAKVNEVVDAVNRCERTIAEMRDPIIVPGEVASSTTQAGAALTRKEWRKEDA